MTEGGDLLPKSGDVWFETIPQPSSRARRALLARLVDEYGDTDCAVGGCERETFWAAPSSEGPIYLCRYHYRVCFLVPSIRAQALYLLGGKCRECGNKANYGGAFGYVRADDLRTKLARLGPLLKDLRLAEAEKEINSGNHYLVCSECFASRNSRVQFNDFWPFPSYYEGELEYLYVPQAGWFKQQLYQRWFTDKGVQSG